MGAVAAKCACLVPPMNVPCDTCDGTGQCKMCKGSGVITKLYDVEVFSYHLDKKGAYKDVKEAPKDCPQCGGWGGTPLFRGINSSVSPAGCMQEGSRGRVTDHHSGDGICRKCKGTGMMRVKPEWLQEAIAAHSPAKYEIPGPLMTSPIKHGPLIVPGAR